MKIKYLIPIVFLIACTNQKRKITLTEVISKSGIQEIIIPGKASIRGLDVFDSETVWLSGSKGIYARSIDGGKTWKTGTINNDTLLDFRDIVAFGKESAIAINAGSPAKIYKTIDGGDNWKMTYENIHPNIFFDSFEFWDNRNGIACADPLDSNFFFILTNDGGNTWNKISVEKLPKPLAQEGGFAASGNSVALSKNGTAMFGTGGDHARVILTNDFGKTWKAVDTPLKAGNPSLGIYSIAALNEKTFAITGGNWQNPDIAENNFAISNDGGNTWELTTLMPNGFRSCVKFVQKPIGIIVCGRTGVDISKDFGKSWINTKLPGYYTFDISPNEDLIAFAGSDSRVAVYTKL